MEQGTCRLGEGECSNTGAIVRGWCQKHYQRLRTTGKLTVKRIMNDDEARFWSKVDRGADDECWPWTGSLNGGGYGIFSAGDRIFGAHRWAYEHFIGDLPADRPFLDHVCHSRAQDCLGKGPCVHRRCVNFLQGDPAVIHLEPVTKLINAQRSHRSPHSRELIIAMHARWATGEPLSALTAETGMTVAALKGRLTSLEESDPAYDRPDRWRRRLTDELVAALYLRYQARESVDTLAEEIDMDPTAIYYQFRQHGLELRPANAPRRRTARENVLRSRATKLSDELVAVLHARRLGGESTAALAKEVEVYKSTLARRFRRITAAVTPPPDGALF
jgi:transposase-like protein